ncbi:hypothetical protein ACJZ2D_010082 [Fusarium nematophilum]
MTSIATNCKEESNSTDCLLRVLIAFLEESQSREDAEYNWDAITFAFTVAISLCAVTFALVTIFQSILAAGPGRRRSDHRAIGRWSAKTEWKWSLWDFSFIHVARTPVLRLSKIEDLLEPAILPSTSAEGKTEESESPSPPNTQTAIGDQSGWVARTFKDGWIKVGIPEASVLPLLHQRKSSNRNPEVSVASWVQFLQKTGLDDIDLDRFSFRRNTADYLPGDMLAAPAYADIGFIVTVMSADGAQMRISPDTGYPTMRGHGCQFEILQHATLGTIGSFSSYEVEGGGASHDPPSPDALRLAAKHSRGWVDIEPCFPVGKMNVRDILEGSRSKSRDGSDFYQAALERLVYTHPGSCNRCKGQNLRYHRDLSYLLGMLVAETPQFLPTLFPWDNLGFSGPLIALTLNSVFWTDLQQSTPKVHVPGLIFNEECRDCGVGTGPWVTPHTVDTCPCVDLKSACAEMLQGSASFKRWRASTHSSQLLELRQHITAQVEEIDDWLQREEGGPGERRSCRRFKLFGDTVALIDIIKSIMYRADKNWDTPDQYRVSFHRIRAFLSQYSRERLIGMDEQTFQADHDLKRLSHLLPTLPDPTDGAYFKGTIRFLRYLDQATAPWTEVEPDSGRGMISKKELLIRHVLIWRTLLMSVLFCLAKDNSSLLSSGVWDDVIPII